MYKPVQQNPPGMLDQGEQKENNCCYNTFCWFFQIAVWLAIGGVLFLFFTLDEEEVDDYGDSTKNEDTFNGALGGLGFIYLVYLILEFCSPTSKYLCNKSSDQGMYEKMGVIFRTPPEIRFHCECYHYVTRHYTTRDKNGHVHHHTRRERVTTYTETYSLPYYSERDVSGLFYLNCNEAMVRKKIILN